MGNFWSSPSSSFSFFIVPRVFHWEGRTRSTYGNTRVKIHLPSYCSMLAGIYSRVLSTKVNQRIRKRVKVAAGSFRFYYGEIVRHRFKLIKSFVLNPLKCIVQVSNIIHFSWFFFRLVCQDNKDRCMNS